MLADTKLVDEFAASYWEKVARNTWGSYVTDVERRAILTAHARAPKAGTALEVGCEAGRWSVLLSQKGRKMVCTDVDPEALRTCRERLPEAECILVGSDDRTLPCASNSVGMVLCVEVPPVINSAWFLSEAHRVLVDGGLIVGVFWNLASPRGSVAALKAALTRNRYDPYKTMYASWRRGVRTKGFRVVSEEGFCWFPFRRTSNSRLARVFAQIEDRLGLRRLPAVSPWIAFVVEKVRK